MWGGERSRISGGLVCVAGIGWGAANEFELSHTHQPAASFALP
jgi:hypothetical protein